MYSRANDNFSKTTIFQKKKFGQMTFFQKSFQSNELSVKWLFGQMTIFRKKLSVKWTFGQINFCSKELVRNYFSVKWHFSEKKNRSFDLSVRFGYSVEWAFGQGHSVKRYSVKWCFVQWFFGKVIQNPCFCFDEFTQILKKKKSKNCFSFKFKNFQSLN
jgi:hypothetical protein